MKLNICVASMVSLEDMLLRLKYIEEPIILLDDDLKIIGKNRFATRIFSDLRRNRRINAFLHYGDIERIKEMKNYSMIHICLFRNEMEYPSMIIRGDGYRAIVVLPMLARLHQNIDNIYGKASGYEMLLQSPLPFGDRNMESTAEDILSISGVDKTSGGRNSVFVLSNLVKRIISEYDWLSSKVNLSIGTGVGGICGSEYDFAMIVSYLLAFLVDKISGENIEISLSAFGDNGILDISADTLLSDEEISLLTTRFDCADAKSTYWFRLLNILADGNLWRFSVESPMPGRIAFRLEAPLAEAIEGCVLRDINIDAIRRILSFVFQRKIS